MNQETILVVEDERSISEVVSLYLKRAGYNVRVAYDGKAAVAAIEEKMPDLMVLDLMLPHVDGMEITRWIRSLGADTPIIMLTARREESDRIAGLESGADDYVVKPFSPAELVSRVRAVLRRSKGNAANVEKPLDFGDLKINPQTRLVTIEGKEITLTVTEFDLLWLLARHPRQVFTRDQLLNRVWDLTEYVDPSTVTVHVRRLREKIEADPGNPRYVQTVWGVGYKFEP
jgi:DNA-binding response OmpR family regulator